MFNVQRSIVAVINARRGTLCNLSYEAVAQNINHRAEHGTRKTEITRKMANVRAGAHDAPNARMTVPFDIQERSFLFACRIITFCRRLNTADPVLRRLSWQLLDAGTSVGANLEEADTGQTKRDFIAKAAIARKESAETRYWLRLIAFADPKTGEHTGAAN
jgi:four helix bundle protein